jgi:putative lipoprotein
MEDQRTVHGTISLPESGTSDVVATVRVQVEDVSRADAPSRVVGEEVYRDVHLERGRDFPFSIAVPADAVDEKSSYTVRAHVDVSGSGDVEVGDFVSTQSYPVLTRGHGNKAVIKVSRV